MTRELTTEAVEALTALNEEAAEPWRVRWTTAIRAGNKECWRVENQEGHVRAEIHPGGDVERNIYTVGGMGGRRYAKLKDLARALWKNVENTYWCPDCEHYCTVDCCDHWDKDGVRILK